LTGIGWTDLTKNYWHGCSKVDTECRLCYAEGQSARFGRDVWGATKDRFFMSDANNAKPYQWNKLAAEHDTFLRVFCGSMFDWAEIHKNPVVAAEMDKARGTMFDTIEFTPHLRWQLLTKRPENIVKVAPARWLTDGWPRNVWLGTSVGYQKSAEIRVPELLRVPGNPAVLFLSVEPMVARVDLSRWLWLTGGSTAGPFHDYAGRRRFGGGVGGMTVTSVPAGDISWVIVGGESGAMTGKASRRARRMDPVDARQLIEDCQDAQVPVFAKQTGTVLAREWNLRHRKGEDPREWPEWMRIRQFPDEVAA
jgi:protein gp37